MPSASGVFAFDIHLSSCGICLPYSKSESACATTAVNAMAPTIINPSTTFFIIRQSPWISYALNGDKVLTLDVSKTNRHLAESTPPILQGPAVNDAARLPSE